MNMKPVRTGGAALLVLFALGLGFWNQGCKGTIPSTATMRATPIPNCVPVLFNGFETLADNGTLTPANASMALYPLYATQGSHSLNIDIMTANNYNPFLAIYGFTPTVWAGKAQAVLDVTADASLLVGGTYHQLQLSADAGGSGIYDYTISSSNPTLVAGSQSVTWTLDFPAPSPGNKGITPNMVLTGIHVVYNNDSFPNGVGNLYLDNFRLLCP